jgi:putative oxidoreductase
MQSLSKKLFATENNYSWTILRVVLGSVMLAHGVQKAFGWFGGFGWDGTIGYFTGTVGLPTFLAAFIILIETLGAFLLILGFAGRVNALLVGAVNFGAFLVDHLPNGFYMNWFGTQKGEGFEFDLLFLANSSFIAINGSGALSVDKWIASRKISTSSFNSVKRSIAA